MLGSSIIKASETYWQEYPVKNNSFPLSDVGYPMVSCLASDSCSKMATFRVILWSNNSYDEVDLYYVVLAYANKHVYRANADEQIAMVRVYPLDTYEQVATTAFNKAKKDGSLGNLDYETFKQERIKQISLSDTKAPYYLYNVNGFQLDHNKYNLETLRPLDAGPETIEDNVDREELPLLPIAGFTTEGGGTRIAPKTGSLAETIWNIVAINHNFINNLLGKTIGNILGALLVLIGFVVFYKHIKSSDFSFFTIIIIILMMLAMPTCVYANDFDFFSLNDKFLGWIGVISMFIAFLSLLIQCIKCGWKGFVAGLVAIVLIFVGGAFSSSWMAYVAYGIMILFFLIAVLAGGSRRSPSREYIEYQGQYIYGYSIDINTFKGDDLHTYTRTSSDLWERID